MPTDMQSPLPACATMWCSEFDIERVAAATDRAKHNKHMLEMSTAGAKKKQEEQEKKRLAKIIAVREEKKQIKKEKAAQQAARVAAVKEHVSQQRAQRVAWEEKQRKQKADHGKATAQYKSAKMKSQQSLFEQRRREAVEKVSTQRKDLKERDRKAKEAFKTQKQKEISEVRQRENEFRKMAIKVKKERVGEYLDEVYDWKGNLKKEKKVAIKNHEQTHFDLKATLSKEQRKWQSDFENAKRIAAEQRAEKLKQLQVERTEFVTNNITIQGKREKQAKAEIARTTEIDTLSEGFRSEFVETGVLENQQVKEIIRVEHESAVKSIMQTQALVLPSITTAAEKLKEEYKEAKLERAAARARDMADEATEYAATITREYGVPKDKLPSMPPPTPLTP